MGATTRAGRALLLCALAATCARAQLGTCAQPFMVILPTTVGTCTQFAQNDRKGREEKEEKKMKKRL